MAVLEGVLFSETAQPSKITTEICPLKIENGFWPLSHFQTLGIGGNRVKIPIFGWGFTEVRGPCGVPDSEKARANSHFCLEPPTPKNSSSPPPLFQSHSILKGFSGRKGIKWWVGMTDFDMAVGEAIQKVMTGGSGVGGVFGDVIVLKPNRRIEGQRFVDRRIRIRTTLAWILESYDNSDTHSSGDKK